MLFECGHKVVHKTHGVGEIEGSEILDLGGQQQDYYILKIVSTGLKVRFPKQSSQQIVRHLASEIEISEIFKIIAGPAKAYSMVWNRRKKEFNEKINSGSLAEIAEVYRDLANKTDEKELSFGEKEMMEKAKARLVSEIAAARSATVEEISSLIDETKVS